MGHFETKLVVLLTCSVFLCAQAELNLDDYSEGPCWSNISEYRVQPNPLWVLTVPKLNFLMGAKSMYIRYAETITGQKVQDDQKLSEINLSMKYLLGALVPAFETKAYSGNFIQACPPTVAGTIGLTSEFYCLASPSINITVAPLPTIQLVDSAKNRPLTATSLDTIVLSDSNEFALIVRCLNSTQRDWKLLTTTKTISDSKKAAVLERINQLGFNMANVYSLTY